MKKRLLTLLLSAAMLLSAGCTAAEKNEGTTSDVTTGITTEATDTDTSASTSAVSDFALWLADRLTAVTGSAATADGAKVTHAEGTVVLSSEEGVTGLRADGYMIRTEGTDTLISALSDKGFDVAVRKFAAVVEKTGTYVVNESEGNRIGNVILGGADLANYKILLPTGPENNTECNLGATENMKFAAGELKSYLFESTGVTLSIEYIDGLEDMSDDEVRAAYGNAILILSDPTATGGRYFDCGEMGAEGSHITVKDGLMKIVGGNQRGSMYAVYTFLEKYVGWRFYTYDFEYLYEADELVIDNVDLYDTPDLDLRMSGMGKSTNNFAKLRHNSYDSFTPCQSAWAGYGLGCTFYHAHSFSYQVEPGMQGSSPYGDQPCLTDDYTKEVIIGSMCALMEQRLAAPYNARIGYNITMLSCSMNDNPHICICESCLKEINATSYADLYLSFVNSAADVFAELYPGVYVYTCAYNYAREIPKVEVPRDNVIIHYCLQGCNAHELTSGDCEKCADITLNHKNGPEYENLKGWAAITENLYVWYYSTTFYSALGPCPNVYQMYNDMQAIYAVGADGVYIEGSSAAGNNFEGLKAYLGFELMWDKDITEEEFYALIDEYIIHVYGEDAAPYIREYLDIHQKAGRAVQGCFINNYNYPFDMIDIAFYENCYDTISFLFDRAIHFAKDTETVKKIEVLRCHTVFLHLAIVYDAEYVNGTAEQKAEYEALYKWLVDTLISHGAKEDRMDVWPEPGVYDLSKNPTFTLIPEMTILSREGRD